MDIYFSNELAPAIGPYCHAAKTGNLVFISGQVPVNAKGAIVGTTMADQTKQTLKNLGSVLEACGLSPSSIVKTSVFITDMNAFGEMNNEYAAFFGSHKPARECVEVAKLANNMLVEISAIAEAT